MKAKYIRDCINIAGNQGHKFEYHRAKEELKQLTIKAELYDQLTKDAAVHRAHCSSTACKYGDSHCPVVDRSGAEGNSFTC